MNINPNVQWWRVVAGVGLFCLAAVVIADQFFEDAVDFVFISAVVVLGLAFMWAFYARGVFWAVAPGVGLLAVAVAGVVSQFTPENNGWVSTLILGAAAYVIAAIPNPRADMKGIYAIGAMLLVIGFILAPLTAPWTIALCAATVLLTGYLLWRNRRAVFQA